MRANAAIDIVGGAFLRVEKGAARPWSGHKGRGGRGWRRRRWRAIQEGGRSNARDVRGWVSHERTTRGGGKRDQRRPGNAVFS